MLNVTTRVVPHSVAVINCHGYVVFCVLVMLQNSSFVNACQYIVVPFKSIMFVYKVLFKNIFISTVFISKATVSFFIFTNSRKARETRRVAAMFTYKAMPSVFASSFLPVEYHSFQPCCTIVGTVARPLHSVRRDPAKRTP